MKGEFMPSTLGDSILLPHNLYINVYIANVLLYRCGSSIKNRHKHFLKWIVDVALAPLNPKVPHVHKLNNRTYLELSKRPLQYYPPKLQKFLCTLIKTTLNETYYQSNSLELILRAVCFFIAALD